MIAIKGMKTIENRRKSRIDDERDGERAENSMRVNPPPAVLSKFLIRSIIRNSSLFGVAFLAGNPLTGPGSLCSRRFPRKIFKQRD